jgi:hypothetical protein
VSGEPDGDESDDDEDPALADDDEDEDSEGDEDELARLRRENAEHQERQRRLEYESQQRRNQEYWDGIEQQALNAFAWEEAQVYEQAEGYVDPEGYKREKLRDLNIRMIAWFKAFGDSKNEARRQQYERAAVPGYAAKIAAYFGLDEEQEVDLLDYPVERMKREAEKMSRYNAKLAAKTKQAQQTTRASARDAKFGSGRGVQTGVAGNTPVKRVKAGSDNHLKAIFAQAARG